MALMLVQIPAWRDNTAWLVVSGRDAFVVDPPEAAPVLSRLRAMPEVTLRAVVNTHHHGDHVGGNLELAEATGCEVVGPGRDRARIPGITREVEPGQRIEVAGLPLRVLEVKAHTRGHVAYALESPLDRVRKHGHHGVEAEAPGLAGRPALFVGDALFLAGCGRLFEGTPEDLFASLSVLAAEDPRSLVCCAHEYTAANLAFARHVLPDDEAIGARSLALPAVLGEARSSLPGTLEEELRTNPFLLCLDEQRRAGIASRLGVDAADPVAVLGALRRAKDEH